MPLNHRLHVTRIVLSLGTVGFGLAAPCRIFAQGVFQLRPSISTSQVHDSNLFFSASAPRADFITRVTPSVDSEYRSPHWTFTGRYTLDAEQFVEHPELSSARARQHGVAGFEYRPTARMVLAAGAELSHTRRPGEIIPEVGLTFARGGAQRFATRSSMTRRLSAASTGSIDYTFSEDRLAGGIAVRSHTGTATTEQRLSLRHTVSAGYRFGQFIFGRTATSSHAINVGWTYALTPRASISIEGGPNVTETSPGLDMTVELRNRFRAGEASISYARAQITAFGVAEILHTQSISATAAWSLRRWLQVRMSPAFYQTERGTLRADVARLQGGAICSIGRSLSLEAMFDGSRQTGVLYYGLGGEMIPRHEVVVRLVAAPGTHSR